MSTLEPTSRTYQYSQFHYRKGPLLYPFLSDLASVLSSSSLTGIKIFGQNDLGKISLNIGKVQFLEHNSTRKISELSCAPYVPSPHEVVRKMLELAQAGPDDVLVDLGCGDGRILTTAIREFSVRKAVGYELREDLYKLGLQEIGKQGLWNRAKIVLGDLFNADLKEATIITLYLTGTANDRLKPKLRAETRPGTRIVSHDFSINGWRTMRRESFEYHTIYLYQIPHAYEIESQLP